MVTRIKLNRTILMPRFSYFLGNITINFLMFECLVTCFPESLFHYYAGYKSYQRYMFQFMPAKLLVKGNEIVLPFDRHSNKTATVRIHVTKDKHIRNGCCYFSENLRIVALKLLKLLNSHYQKYQFTFISYGIWGPL